MASSPLRSIALLVALLVSACSTGRSVVGGLPDAAEPVDAAPDATPDATDAPAPVDVADVPAADRPDVPVDIPAPRCASDTDCANGSGGPSCDLGTGRCVPCTAASDRCPSGQYCVAAMNRCDNGCRDDAACAATAATPRCEPTSRACVACVTDEHCPAGNLCVGSVCVAGCNAASRCPTGEACCAGACVNPQSNVAHCGACGNRCALDRAAAVCRNATCAVMSCTLPFGDCDGSAANGCEVDTTADTAHCGACGRACAARAHATATCAAAVCVYACDAGFADCDGEASNGCEVDTRASAEHCGACGSRCAPASATGACVAGACTVASCTSGRADCNASAADGCEVTTATDAANCGACGTACPEVGGTHRCFAGSCAARSCAAVLALNPTATSGPYRLDLDGDGPMAARTYACDMRDGGWTVVANQVPTELLADSNATLGEASFGDVAHSWRLGNPDITLVRPTLAWRLSDEVNSVYVVRSCVVDWSRDYIDVMSATECTVGYTTAALNVVVNGAWTYCSARGIGINNLGRSCSIRMNEGGFGRGVGALTNGRAYTCDYNTVRRVSLAFR
jgi:hypothetical protein